MALYLNFTTEQALDLWLLQLALKENFEGHYVIALFMKPLTR